MGAIYKNGIPYGNGIVDQQYDATSENAQSGTAVAEALLAQLNAMSLDGQIKFENLDLGSDYGGGTTDTTPFTTRLNNSIGAPYGGITFYLVHGNYRSKGLFIANGITLRPNKASYGVGLYLSWYVDSATSQDSPLKAYRYSPQTGWYES